ncbi:hypothetical protein [Methylobacterium segetis]|uniref:hypothetical protein n=1 Tax=Methylobacterium segetis TaxID=2488750 RepID=UPI00104749DC|nr:hypothetical protein [Methylobacterium segetis]
MIWALLHGDRLVFRGTRAGALDAAERAGALSHLVTVEIGGKAERIIVAGRGFHEDGTELPARLDRGYLIVPAQMLGLGQRRAA